MRSAILILMVLTLTACGMNRAVGVLPNTLDDLAEVGQRADAPARR